MVPWKDENARIRELQVRLEGIKQSILQGPHDSLKDLLRPSTDLKSYSNDAQGMVKLLLDGFRKLVAQYNLKENDYQQAIKDRNNFQRELHGCRQDKRILNDKIDRIKQEHSEAESVYDERIRILEQQNNDLKTNSWNFEREKQNMSRKYQRETDNTRVAHEEELQQLRSLHHDQIRRLEEANADAKLIHDVEKEEEIERMKQKFMEDKRHLEDDYAAQAGQMRENIETLNGAILAREKFTPMADHQLKSGFLDLASDIDHLSRVTWKFNRTQWPDELLGRLDKNQRRVKQQISQDALWAIMFENILCSPFRLFGDEGRALEQQWNEAFGKGDKEWDNGLYIWPKSSIEAERWRYETIKTCKEALDQPASEYDPRMKLKRAFGTLLAKTRDDLLEALGKVCDLDESQVKLIESVPEKAARMWLEMGTQRCRILVVMCGSNCKFEIERVNKAENGKLELVTIAELRRYGNSKGQNLDKKEIVSGCEGKMVSLPAKR